MNVRGASAVNQTEFQPVEGTIGIEPQYETNIYLESVLPRDVTRPHSMLTLNPKRDVGVTIEGFRVLPKNPLS